MPLGKYSCDYCDKQFRDTAGARKRHLQSSIHLRNRKLWYDSLKGEHGVPFFQPDGTIANGVCQHFIRTGVCKYGDACKYFHPKPQMVNPTSVASGETLKGSVSNYGNLPPSLQPPPEGGYPPLPFVDWG
ncbi:zinc finger CCCH domain-containing protein 3 [Carex littledalei]|uniref:Zinc finger CCCH domain-containing protein 3 n=1 Tax=Carex littledalei TaxID=544730 RepID=A0A833RAZ2_9POAL|nr:zinc finger CCCH domain-containing protein 3 [Carex littledalei]